MLKSITSFVLFSLLIIGMVQGQQLEPVPLNIKHSSQSIIFENSSEHQDIGVKNYVYSTLDDSMNITWKKVVEFSDSKKWQFAICDKYRCYLPFVNSHEVAMFPYDTSEMTVHLYTKGGKGDSAIVYVKIYRNDIDNSDSLYLKTSFIAETTTAIIKVEEVEYNDVTIFPNPADYYFNIKSPSHIGIVIVHDILGRVMIKKNLNGSHHGKISIENLRGGTYFVTSYDLQGRRLKTLRLLKRTAAP